MIRFTAEVLSGWGEWITRRWSEPHLAVSDELQIAWGQVRRAFKDGNDATITKAFVWAIFIEIEPAFLLVVEEVEVLLGKLLLDCFLVFATRKGGRAIYPEAVGIDF